MPVDLSKVRIVGSVEEAREAGLDPRRVQTCGPSRPGVIGCPVYEDCERPEKNETGKVKWSKGGEVLPAYEPGAIRSGPGPMTCGISEWRQLGGQTSVVNRLCRCWEYPYIKLNRESVNQGGKKPTAGCKMIAIEGEVFAMPGSIATKQDDGKIIHLRQPGGIEAVIKPFPRPQDSPDYAMTQFARAELEREARRTEQSPLSAYVRLGNEPEPEPAGPSEPQRGRGPRGAASRG